MRICAVVACMCLLSMVSGCGNKDSGQPKLMPVSGTVTLDGKVISGVMLSFVPTGSTHGTGANGRTDKAGKYELTTVRGGKGSPVGEYKVIAVKMVMPDGSDLPRNSEVPPILSAAKQVLPPIYSDSAKTVLRATVGEGDNTVDFSLTSKR